MNKDVKYLTPKRSVKEIHGTERRAASAQAVAELMFVKAAQEQQLDETTIAEYPDLFVEWDANWRGKQGDIVQDEGNLYTRGTDDHHRRCKILDEKYGVLFF
jgi:hypothetical protein